MKFRCGLEGEIRSCLRYFVATGVPHDSQYRDWSMDGSKEKLKGFGTTHDVFSGKGATNMYTSNTEFGDLRFYRFLTTYLAMDHEYILAKIMPYIKKVNFYLNESRHAGGRLYCGANVPEEDLKLLVKDSRVRIPRMLSASESKETAKAFMTNAFFTI